MRRKRPEVKTGDFRKTDSGTLYTVVGVDNRHCYIARTQKRETPMRVLKEIVSAWVLCGRSVA